MKCSKCDSDNSEDAEHCGTCGASLSSGVSASKGMVSFQDAIKLGFEGYFTFNGRSTRAEFWFWALFATLANLAFRIVDSVIGTGSIENGGLLTFLWGFATLIPGLAVGARRLHDINKSGWWQLMWLISWLLIPMFVLLWWAAKRGDDGENNYGASSLPDISK